MNIHKKYVLLSLCFLVLIPYVMASETKLSAVADNSTVHVVLANVEDLCGFDLTVEWSSSLVLVGYMLHSPWINSWIAMEQTTPISYRIVIVGLRESFSGSAELVTLTLTGHGTVTFGLVKLSTSYYKPIPFTVAGCGVFASESFKWNSRCLKADLIWQ